MSWLWLLLGVLGFAVGFWLSWRQHRKHLHARINEVVAEEVVRAVHKQVLDELRHGGSRKRGGSHE